MFKEKLAIIIPTKDRHKDISCLLESILSQGVKPTQIIVVDGGSKPVENLLKRYSTLEIDYIRSLPPSLTVQRNVGLKKLKDEVTLVSFLDDDVVLGREALKNMMRFWDNKSQDIAGAGFNLTNVPYRGSVFMEKLFFVNPEKPGAVLRSGFQSKNHLVKETTPVRWLSGGSMVWRRSLFGEFQFDEWFEGYGHCEDLDFSYRVGSKYKMFIVADANAQHFSENMTSQENIEFSFILGKMQVMNRLYLVRKNTDLSLLLSYWSCFGVFVHNAFVGLIKGRKRYLLRARGNIEGFISDILRQKKEIETKR